MSIKQPYTTYLVALLLSLHLSSYIRAYVRQSVSVSAIFQSIQMQIRRLFAEPVVAGGRGSGHWLWVVVATRSVVLFATINLCGALWLWFINAFNCSQYVSDYIGGCCGRWGGVNLHKTLEAGKWKMSIEAAAQAESGAQWLIVVILYFRFVFHFGFFCSRPFPYYLWSWNCNLI